MFPYFYFFFLSSASHITRMVFVCGVQREYDGYARKRFFAKTKKIRCRNIEEPVVFIYSAKLKQK